MATTPILFKSTQIMQYTDVSRQWMSANAHLCDGKISKILGVAVSLSRAKMAHTHSMQDTYAWLFADYTWKHAYTPAVSAFIAAEQMGIPQCQVPPVTSAGAVLSAGAATAAAIPMADAVAHRSTLIKTLSSVSSLSSSSVSSSSVSSLSSSSVSSLSSSSVSSLSSSSACCLAFIVCIVFIVYTYLAYSSDTPECGCGHCGCQASSARQVPRVNQLS